MKKKKIALIVFAAALIVGAIALFAYLAAGQNQTETAKEVASTHKKTDLSSINDVAKLITLEARYHDVSKFSYDADEGITGLGRHGYKKAWREYDAKARFGINASKVKPIRDGNTVTIEMPHAALVGEPKITKMYELISETGFLTDFSVEDERTMNRLALKDVKKKAKNDTSMINQATENAQKILKQWVQSMGKACDEDLTVEFKLVD